MRTKIIVALALILLAGLLAYSIEAWRVPPGPTISPPAIPTRATSLSPGLSVASPSGRLLPTVSPTTTTVLYPSSSPSLGPSSAPPDPVLIGAGDIANCGTAMDSATTTLLARQPGIVFTAGDNAYPDGTKTNFADCYGPTWGRELARTKPVPGNHDHDTAGLAGYLGYFGAAADPQGTPWYSYDLGVWPVVVLDATCAPTDGCGPDTKQGRWLVSDGQGAAGGADPARGIRELVAGTGGAELRAFGAPAPNNPDQDRGPLRGPAPGPA